MDLQKIYDTWKTREKVIKLIVDSAPSAEMLVVGYSFGNEITQLSLENKVRKVIENQENFVLLVKKSSSVTREESYVLQQLASRISHGKNRRKYRI
ncbi:MAG: hypothetical protein HRK26_04500 [Rickettsiaceae bacterium H1]|nr:hypothetical protein [Rickettsiaceae bacterium H1]